MGPTRRRKCYITPAFSVVPKDKGDKIRIGGAHKGAERLHHPCILSGPQRQGGQNQKWWGPQVGGNATSPLHSRLSPKRGGQNQNGWGPQVDGEATSPLHSQGSPKTRGTKSELVGPTNGWKCYISRAFAGLPKVKEGKIRNGGAQKWAERLHHPCSLGDPQSEGGQKQNWWGPQVGGKATSPLHSQGSPKSRRTKSELVGPTSGRKCYITSAFLGLPKVKEDKIRNGGAHKWVERLHHPCILGCPQREGDKIRIGGAHKWAERLHHPCILRGPQRQGGQNQN